MNDKTVASEMPISMMRAVAAEGCRAYVGAIEMRRNILKAHLKAAEDEVRSAKTLMQRLTSPTDGEALQHTLAQLFADRLEHQAALSREYSRVFADSWSAWFEECQNLTNRWLMVAEQGGQESNRLSGLAGAFGNFYEQLERMSTLMTRTAPIAPSSGRPNGQSRARASA